MQFVDYFRKCLRDLKSRRIFVPTKTNNTKNNIMKTAVTLQLNYLIDLAISRAKDNTVEPYQKGWAANVVEFNRTGYFVEIDAKVVGATTVDFVITIDTEVVAIETGHYISHTWMKNAAMIEIIQDEIKKYSKR